MGQCDACSLYYYMLFFLCLNMPGGYCVIGQQAVNSISECYVKFKLAIQKLFVFKY